jgi:hypothetical protein
MGQKKNIKTKPIRPLLSSSGVKNKANQSQFFGLGSPPGHA